MANKTIPEYGAAGSIDPVNDQFLIYQQSTNSYRKINRNTTLGITGAPVGNNDTQTLTNKTISGASNTITDINPTSITGLPSVSSIVTLTGAQTLTNKTLTAPTINGGTIDGSAIIVDSITGKTSATSGTVFGLPVSSGKIPGTSITNNSITASQVAANTLTGNNINWSATSPDGIWWQEIGRVTLGVAGDVITVSGIPARKYLKVYIDTGATGGTNDLLVTFNGDVGNNYSIRISTNGAADVTSNTRASLSLAPSTAGVPNFAVLDILNITTREKNIQGTITNTNTAGAANAPERRILAGKWTNTTTQITSITATNGTGTGDFSVGSQIIVLGHN